MDACLWHAEMGDASQRNCQTWFTLSRHTSLIMYVVWWMLDPFGWISMKGVPKLLIFIAFFVARSHSSYFSAWGFSHFLLGDVSCNRIIHGTQDKEEFKIQSVHFESIRHFTGNPVHYGVGRVFVLWRFKFRGIFVILSRCEGSWIGWLIEHMSVLFSELTRIWVEPDNKSQSPWTCDL